MAGVCAYPGQDAEMWFSDDLDERAEAILLCGSCSVHAACFLEGQTQTHGIWGGVDMNARRQKVDPRVQEQKRARHRAVERVKRRYRHQRMLDAKAAYDAGARDDETVHLVDMLTRQRERKREYQNERRRQRKAEVA